MANYYAQATMPSGQLGDIWVNTSVGTFNIYGAAGWNPVFDINAAYGGLMPIGGANMVGPITGNHGLVPKHNPNFSGNALIEGKEIVTADWVTTFVKDQIALQLAANQASSGGSSSGSGGTSAVANVNFAIAMGTTAQTTKGGNTTGTGAVGSTDYRVTIGPGAQGLWPYFTVNGTPVAANPQDHYVAVCVAPVTTGFGLFTSGNWNMKILRVGDTSQSFIYQAYMQRDTGSTESVGIALNYIAVAMMKS